VLGNWIGTQRADWKRGKLSSERISRLEAFPSWSWDPFADTWDLNFEAVQAFRAKHNRWPSQSGSGEEGVLARWVRKQRTGWKKDMLSPDRIKRLEALPGWSWDQLTDKWDQTFAAVLAFRGKHNRWPSQSGSGEERVLAIWVGMQRTGWKKDMLSPDRIKRLEALPGWSWDPLTDKWDQTFAAVLAFRGKHNRWPLADATGAEDVLARWISNQRKVWKMGELSLDRIKRLEALPGWSWDRWADTWDQNFEAVQAFHAKHNRWPLGSGSGEEDVLARWISKQRMKWKKDALSPERVTRLEDLPGWVWSASG
jgi:hypothetical protein